MISLILPKFFKSKPNDKNAEKVFIQNNHRQAPQNICNNSVSPNNPPETLNKIYTFG